MDQLTQNLRIAFRSLGRQRAFCVTAVLTLALGIGFSSAIFTVINAVLLKPLPYAESERLLTLGQTLRSNPTEPVGGSVSHLNFLDWRRESRTMSSMALFSRSRFVVTGLGDAAVVDAAIVTPGFFETFKAQPLMGRGFTDEENLPSGPPAIIVSHAFWQERLGGRADVLDQAVEVSGVPRPIVGVAPAGFAHPDGARLWMAVRNDDDACGRACVYLNNIGRLADGATVASARDEMASIAAALEETYPAENTDVTVAVQTLHDRVVGDVRPALVVLMAAVIMVLLIACANVANLVLVRSAARQGEMSVRMALGAGRRGVMAYILTENFVLGMAAAATGLLLSVWGIDALKALAPASLPRLDEVQFDGATFLFAAAMGLATTLLVGLGPSLRLSRVSPVLGLGHRGEIGHNRRSWTRSTLLVGEVAVALVLLLGAGLLLRSLSEQQRTDPGFQHEGRSVFLISLPASRYTDEQAAQAHDRLAEAFAGIAGVGAVARVSALPLGNNENVFNFVKPDEPPPPIGQVPTARHEIADANYFTVMGIPILAGRGFEAADREGAPGAVVISRRMADVFWPGVDPVGRPIQVDNGSTATVVGVVGDVRSLAIVEPPQPEMYRPLAQVRARTMNYVLQSAIETPQVLSAARAIVQRFDSQLPLIFPDSMSAIVDGHLARPRFYLFLLALFAVLAVVLAAVGIYGVVAYVVSQRTREIGVRMALGARQRDVVGLMLWQGLKPAAIGVALGLVAAVGAARTLGAVLYTVSPYDPATLAGVTLALAVVVVVACVIPAGRASRVPPGDALRGE